MLAALPCIAFEDSDGAAMVHVVAPCSGFADSLSFCRFQVQENCIDLVGRIADRGAEYVPAREWMRICFESLEMLKVRLSALRSGAPSVCMREARYTVLQGQHERRGTQEITNCIRATSG